MCESCKASQQDQDHTHAPSIEQNGRNDKGRDTTTDNVVRNSEPKVDTIPEVKEPEKPEKPRERRLPRDADRKE